jgi:spermidine dehydrogenase
MSEDRQLGMDRPIGRRDFLNSVAVGVGGALAAGTLPDALVKAAALEQAIQSAVYYPPTRTGMRGSHDGSWEVAHGLRDGSFWKAAGTPVGTGETYDLIVVGGGISGLAAAHFFRARAGASSRVLVLDNHDDFGGHAKRNEFHVTGRMLLMNGGTAGIDSPTPYSATADGLLKTLGVDATALAARFARAGGSTLQATGLRPAYFFDKETFGADTLVVGTPGGGGRGGRAGAAAGWDEFLARTPLSTEARHDWRRIRPRSDRLLTAVGPGREGPSVEDELSGLPARSREGPSRRRQNLSAADRGRVGRRDRRRTGARLLGHGLSGLRRPRARRAGGGSAHELHGGRLRERRLVSFSLSRATFASIARLLVPR